jgi:hypothetical protein
MCDVQNRRGKNPHNEVTVQYCTVTAAGLQKSSGVSPFLLGEVREQNIIIPHRDSHVFGCAVGFVLCSSQHE